MQFTVDGYTIAGAPLTLTGAPDTTIRVGDGGAGDAGLTATISAVLAGSTRLVKTDGGTLVLTGANTYTGGTAINGGTLRISSGRQSRRSRRRAQPQRRHAQHRRELRLRRAQ